MKPRQSGGDGPNHPTVAGGFEFKCGGKAIAVGFTEKRLSAHAGAAPFWVWLHGTDWGQRLKAALPHRLPQSNNSLSPLEKAQAFVHGLLGEARKLTHMAYFFGAIPWCRASPRYRASSRASARRERT